MAIYRYRSTEDPIGRQGVLPESTSGWRLGFDRGEEGDRFEYDETMQSEAQLLGAGKRLFGDNGAKKRFELVETQTVGDNGVTTAVYRPADDRSATRAPADTLRAFLNQEEGPSN
jgi:hypothetical protein